MQELVLMMHEAQHAKASAKQELERVDQQLQVGGGDTNFSNVESV